MCPPGQRVGRSVNEAPAQRCQPRGPPWPCFASPWSSAWPPPPPAGWTSGGGLTTFVVTFIFFFFFVSFSDAVVALLFQFKFAGSLNGIP